MNLFAFLKRRGRATTPRLADPIAQAMSAGDHRSADVIWFGGMTYRAKQ